MADNHIRMLCSVIKVDLVYEKPGEAAIPFFDSVEDSPLMQRKVLRDMLRLGAASQKSPYLYPAEYGMFYASFHAGEGYLYMGPMCSERLNPAKRRQMYHVYGIDSGKARTLPVFSLPEIRNMVLLTNSALKNGNLENEELIRLNQIISGTDTGILHEQTKFVLKEEAENDDASYRHSYHEEQLLMHAIREGRTSDAIRLAENMDRDSGRLSSHEIAHWKTSPSSALRSAPVLPLRAAFPRRRGTVSADITSRNATTHRTRPICSTTATEPLRSCPPVWSSKRHVPTAPAMWSGARTTSKSTTVKKSIWKTLRRLSTSAPPISPSCSKRRPGSVCRTSSTRSGSFAPPIC